MLELWHWDLSNEEAPWYRFILRKKDALGTGIFWESFAREIVAWPSDYPKSESISEQSQEFWWLENKYRKDVNHQRAATPNPSLVSGLPLPETCFSGPWRSGPIAPALNANAILKVLVHQGMRCIGCGFVTAMLNLLSALRIRLQNLQESTACSPTGCVNLCCLSFHTGTSIPETCCQGSLISTWKVGRAMCTLTSNSHLPSLFQFSQDQEQTPDEKGDGVLGPTCPQDCFWDETCV